MLMLQSLCRATSFQSRARRAAEDSMGIFFRTYARCAASLGRGLGSRKQRAHPRQILRRIDAHAGRIVGHMHSDAMAVPQCAQLLE
jgi:hypothetical protein